MEASPALSLAIQKSSTLGDLPRIVDGSEKLSRDYSIVRELGQGTTSSVQQAVRKADGQDVAIKTMRSDDPEMLTKAKDEFELLRQVSHPNVVRVYDLIALPGRVVLVLELCTGWDLGEAVSMLPRRFMPEDAARPLCKCLLSAVGYLHSRRIIHRDLKPQNVLVSKDRMELKVIDFNTAHRLRSGSGLTPAGTRLYAAPEVLLGGSPNELSDIWGAGLCMYLMLSGKLPQSRERWQDLAEWRSNLASEDVRLDTKRWQNISDDAKAVVSQTLAVEPSERVPAIILLESAWFEAGRRKQPQKSISCSMFRTTSLQTAPGGTSELFHVSRSKVRRHSNCQPKLSQDTLDMLDAHSPTTPSDLSLELDAEIPSPATFGKRGFARNTSVSEESLAND